MKRVFNICDISINKESINRESNDWQFLAYVITGLGGINCLGNSHTHTHTYIYIYIYIYRERERERKR